MPHVKHHKNPHRLSPIRHRYFDLKHLFDIPINCRFRMNKLFSRPVARSLQVSILRLLNKSIFASRPVKWTLDSISDYVPTCAVAPNSPKHVGQFFSVKLGRVVKYRSLEKRRFLRKLEKSHCVVWYVEEPFVVAYCSEQGKATIHVPDVLVWLRDRRMVVCRLESVESMNREIQTARWAALNQYCKDAGWGLLLTDGRVAAQDQGCRVKAT